MIDRQALRLLLRDLVAIDSVNPSLVPGARGEAEAAEFLRAWLGRQGVAAELQEVASGRPNVVAWLGPAAARRSKKDDRARAALALIAHIDTVGAGDMPDPFTPREKDGRLYGRGAQDIKSGVAAICAVAAAVVRDGLSLKKPLLVAAVVDEECNSAGTLELLKEFAADAAVVLEPTDLKLCLAHKGYAWLEVITHGRAAHGSLPQEGRDAIRYMGRVLTALEELDRRLAARSPHPLLGLASLHAALILGGQELSSYPAECRLQMERRTLPGESDASVKAELEAVLAELSAQDAEFRADVLMHTTRAPYEIPRHAPIAAAMGDSIRRVTSSVEICGMPFWTDTSLLAAAGVPGVVFGPRGKGMHGAAEYVELGSVEACADVLYDLVKRQCV